VSNGDQTSRDNLHRATHHTYLVEYNFGSSQEPLEQCDMANNFCENEAMGFRDRVYSRIPLVTIRLAIVRCRVSGQLTNLEKKTRRLLNLSNSSKSSLWTEFVVQVVIEQM
jgi:hypothetical protein